MQCLGHNFPKIGNLERYLVTCSECVKHFYQKNVYQLRETLFEKLDAVNFRYKDEKKKPFINFCNVWFWVALCKKKVTQSNRDYKVACKACTGISFYSITFYSRTSFPLQCRSPSVHTIVYYYSSWMSYPKQKLDGSELYWSEDSNEEKTLWYTGTAELKTKSSRNSGGFCRRLYRWFWRARPIYRVPASREGKIGRCTGALWTLVERVASLWIQQRKAWYPSFQLLSFTESCKRARHWSDSLRKGLSIRYLQFRW